MKQWRHFESKTVFQHVVFDGLLQENTDVSLEEESSDRIQH